MGEKIKTCMIVSVYNFDTEVDGLCTDLIAVMESMAEPFEMVFVDDGSSDRTFEILAERAKKDKRIRIVRMRSSFGEAAALEAGIRYSEGERIIYLTGRVRINPEGLPVMIEALGKEADLVVGWRTPRRDAAINRWISAVFNRLAGRISKVRLHDINSGVIVTTRSLLEKISLYGDMQQFIPILAAQQGYRVKEIKIEQLAGWFRKSRYPNEYLQRFLDVITVFFLSRYSKKPIHFLGLMGSLLMMVGMAILGYLFVFRILQMGPIAGRPLLTLGALLLVIGIQMISIGLLGEMIIYTHAADLDSYNVEEIINENR
jgi:glycosyltransferase involved in cell wall biosynthesis